MFGDGEEAGDVGEKPDPRTALCAEQEAYMVAPGS